MLKVLMSGNFLRQGLDQFYVSGAIKNIVEDYQHGKAQMQSIIDTWKS